jgi:signal transduction histidine kinase/CHASE3 domain sensor protein
MLIGLSALAGWVFDINTMKSFLPSAAGMKANTALAFVMAGAAVFISAGAPSRWRRDAALLLTAAVALLGGLSLAEELFASNFGIDQWLFRDASSGPSALVRPGRMAPATAYCFVAMAAALALSVLPRLSRLQMPLAAALSAAVAVIGVLYLLAYISNRGFGYRWGATTTMAAATTLTFGLLGTATMLRARRLQDSGWALGRVSTAGFVLGMVTMLGATELASSFARDMEQTTLRVVSNQQNLRALQEIRTDMRTLESAQRGHLVLGDESFVIMREAGKAGVRAHLAELAALPAADALPEKSLRSLRVAIEARLAYGDRLIELRRTQGFDAARALFNSGEDVALTQAITDTIAPLAAQERARLDERQRHLKEVTTTTFLLLPISSFLGLTVLLAGLYLLDDGFGRRRRAEQAVERGHAQLQVAFDNMAEGIRVIDARGAIVQTNPAGSTVHGLIDPAPTLHDIVVQVDASGVDGRTLLEHEWPAPRALRGEFVRNVEVRFQRRDDGRFVVTELTTAPLPTESGQPLQVIVTSHDVTERKLAEAAVRDGKARLEHVIKNLPAGVLIYGLTGGRVHWNRAALDMYGFSPEADVDMTRDDYRNVFEVRTLDGELLPFADWPMSRVMRGEVLGRIELRVRRLDRDWERVLSCEGAPVLDVAGEPLVFLTVTDISARKSAEAMLNRLNAELEERVAQRTNELQAKSRELESFCYSVSHDLKAPLRGIDGYSRLLADEYGDQLDADARMFIGNVRTATAQMNTLIDDLLAYSQQERRTLMPTRIPLRQFVAEKIARRSADLAHVTLQVDVEDIAVRADRDGLAMALRNLLDNAVKFSARSTPPLITIRSRSNGDRCVLSVQDNGTGFDMRFYDKIFEIFQRLHRAEDYPGTGVGLALVRKAMERMGGRVWAESSAGNGATFYLELESADLAAEAAA